jgi:hypothetical protein
MAYPMGSILEDISAEVANINVPTVLLAGELDQVDSIERHKIEVLAYLPNAEFTWDEYVKYRSYSNHTHRRVIPRRKRPREGAYSPPPTFSFSRCSLRIALRLSLILLPSSARTFTRI